MKRLNLFRKLKSKRGESFLEILIAILVVSFGCMIVSTMFINSASLDMQTSVKDTLYYQNLSDMENMFEKDSTGTGTVTITDTPDESAGETGTGGSATVDVDTYGDDSAAYKYNNKG